RFFDADGDGDLDLYVVSGGNDFAPTEVALTDRLYFNKGNGNFEKSPQALPIAQRFESTSCVRPADYDQDGDLDLFVGTRLRPLLYGVPVNGYLLENDGKGFFTEVSKQKAPALEKLGMITDAIWSDIDRDADMDLIVVGEWMPITLFKNEGGRFEKMKQGTGLEQTAGWWNSIAKADLDGDGDEDFIVGNHGLNSRFKASVEKPVSCYVNDFDQNRTVEQIVCTYNGEKAYPLVLRHDMVTQMPQLKKQFLKYDSYKEKTIEELFAPEVLERSVVHEVTQLASVVLLSNGDGTFVLQELPQAAQFSPVYAITIGEYTGDDHLDVVLGGNLFGVKPEVGRYDASYGTFLAGKGDGSFESYTVQKSGIQLEGEVRAIVNVADKLYIARNNKTMQVFEKGIK
ncbi:MAG: VCBS repeat-containing protein, partial [Bacteroidota bacterium]